MADYKILSLDGGGSWALIQALTLGKLYPNTSGRDILKKFDLVVATSGGSLVAGALAVGMTPTEVFNLFYKESDRRKVFVEKWSAGITRCIGIGPRYITTEKLIGLRDVLAQGSKCSVNGDSLLNAMQLNGEKFPDFLITSFDYDRQRAVFFRSNGKSKASSDPDNYIPVSLAEALHASSNAPVNYFDEPARFDNPKFSGKRFWDGGTAGLNNPVLAGVIEAMSNGIKAADIKILSIGTGNVMLPVADALVHPPLAITRDSICIGSPIKKLAKTIVDDPPDTASYDAFRILHGDAKQTNEDGTLTNADNTQTPIRLVRFNPLVQPIYNAGQWQLPSSLSEKEFSLLVGMDMDAVKQTEVDLINNFCHLWIEGDVNNQPIQSYDNSQCKIGFTKFNEAKIAAHKIGLS